MVDAAPVPASGKSAKDVRAWEGYRKGSKTSTGDTIQEVLQSSTNGIVFLTTDGDLSWEYDQEKCQKGTEATQRATGLLGQIGAADLRGSNLRRAHLLIAVALQCAFDDTSDAACKDLFADSDEFLTTKQTERVQFAYVLAVLVAAAALTGGGLFLTTRPVSDIVRDFSLSAALGSLGALLSVAQRFRTIPIGRYASGLSIVSGGLIRVVLGALFGAVALLLQRSGIALSAVQGNSYLMATVAMIAGFSERFIPDLLAKMEGQIGSN